MTANASWQKIKEGISQVYCQLGHKALEYLQKVHVQRQSRHLQCKSDKCRYNWDMVLQMVTEACFWQQRLRQMFMPEKRSMISFWFLWPTQVTTLSCAAAHAPGPTVLGGWNNTTSSNDGWEGAAVPTWGLLQEQIRCHWRHCREPAGVPACSLSAHQTQIIIVLTIMIMIVMMIILKFAFQLLMSLARAGRVLSLQSSLSCVSL